MIIIEKKRNVYKELNDLKFYIRETYGNKIENYIFDIVFHCTDDLTELNFSQKVLETYMKKKLLIDLKLALKKKSDDEYVKRKNR